jgi:hypothetical protein
MRKMALRDVIWESRYFKAGKKHGSASNGEAMPKNVYL